MTKLEELMGLANINPDCLHNCRAQLPVTCVGCGERLSGGVDYRGYTDATHNIYDDAICMECYASSRGMRLAGLIELIDQNPKCLVHCHARTPVTCVGCGRTLRDGVDYYGVNDDNHYVTEDVICNECFASCKTDVEKEMRQALEDFKKRVGRL